MTLEQRTFGRLKLTGAAHASASVVGLGCWQLGADWGEVSEDDAHATLQGAVDSGVTFIDTADVYGDGRSEQLVGRFVAAHPDAGFTVTAGAEGSGPTLTFAGRGWTGSVTGSGVVRPVKAMRAACPGRLSAWAVHQAVEVLPLVPVLATTRSCRDG